MFEMLVDLYGGPMSDPVTKDGEWDDCFSREVETLVLVPFIRQLSFKTTGNGNLMASVCECCE